MQEYRVETSWFAGHQYRPISEHTNMATGQIKRLARDRGFGFIRPEGDSEDIFFHTSAVQGGVFDSLQEGQTVE